MTDSKKKMLITGVSGLLGNNLAYYFKDKYNILGLYCSHPVFIDGIQTGKCDLSCYDGTRNIINEFYPEIIIHCASLTNVDQCESDSKITNEINVIGTRNIVEIISGKSIKLVYISTDSVYDGARGDFSEDDNINPLNCYGRSKYEGELEVLKKKESVILRTNLFGWNIQEKESLGEWVLNELKAGRRIQSFKDVYFSTLYTLELARIIDIAVQSQLSGIYNCGGADSCSKFDFAMKIADCFGLDKKLIEPVSIDDFPFKAKRGKNLSLDVGKIQRALDYRIPTIDQSIDEFYRDYRCGLPDELKRNNSSSKEASFFIPYGRHWVDEDDIRAVAEVLRSDRITQGPKIEEFERGLSDYCDARFAVAMSSGTAALHSACLAAGVGKGDEVVVSPNTFVASVNCVVYCGATPIFADIDSRTYNIDPAEIEKKITLRTKAVIPVDFAGQSCDMDSIHKIIKQKEKEYKHKIYIIEDACHALGSRYRNKKVGSCAFSDMTVMSFHPVKHITTGEGGMVFTNDRDLYHRLERFRSHGITSDPKEFINKDFAFSSRNSQGMVYDSPNPWYYEQKDLGFNYRITDIQCALGVNQIKKLDRFRQRRREIVDIYNKAFEGVSRVVTPYEDSRCDSNFHLYVLLFDFEKIGINRVQLMSELKKRGIQTQVHYIPVHLQPFYRKHFGTNHGDYSCVEQYYQKCLSIPLYPAMSDLDVAKVVREIIGQVKGE